MWISSNSCYEESLWTSLTTTKPVEQKRVPVMALECVLPDPCLGRPCSDVRSYAHQRNQVSCHHSSDKPADYSCFLTLLSAPFCPCTPHCFPPLQPCIESRWHQCNIWHHQTIIAWHCYESELAFGSGFKWRSQVMGHRLSVRGVA